MDLVYRYRPGLIVKAIALLSTPLGLLQLAEYSDVTLALSGLFMLVAGLVALYAWRTLEVRLHAASRSGESFCQPLLGQARQEKFSFDDIQEIEVLGNLNFASIYLNRADRRYYPAGDSFPRTEGGKQLLRERLAEIKALLDKPLKVDPTVQKWFQVY